MRRIEEGPGRKKKTKRETEAIGSAGED